MTHLKDFESSHRPQRPILRFGIPSLFWLTFIVGLALAYLQRIEPDGSRDLPEMLVGAMIAVLIGVATGTIFGRLTQKYGDAIFWSTLIAAFGYISTATDPLYVPYHRLAWAGVGAVSGAIASTLFLDRWWIRGLACAVGAGLVMVVYYFLSDGNRGSSDLTFDLNLAPIIGFAVAGFVMVLMWLETKQKMPRYITATWLMIAVILGNYFSRPIG